jgi:RNase P subunit RPR2
VKFYAAVASISEGSPSFILLATGILERSDTSFSRTIHRRYCRTWTRTLHTKNLSPRSGIGPRHQLYTALSGLTSKGRTRDKEAALVSYAAAVE